MVYSMQAINYKETNRKTAAEKENIRSALRSGRIRLSPLGLADSDCLFLGIALCFC
jgi:hypothetical protein